MTSLYSNQNEVKVLAKSLHCKAYIDLYQKIVWVKLRRNVWLNPGNKHEFPSFDVYHGDTIDGQQQTHHDLNESDFSLPCSLCWNSKHY